MDEYARFINRIGDRREKICHELAISFASKQAHDENDKDFQRTVLGQLEPHERMLCEYAWCFDDLMSRFDDILKRYCEMRDEKLNRR